MKKGLLQKSLTEKRAQCLNCAHMCLLESGMKGICRMRKNEEGEIFVLNYGKLATINTDPIEKKPLYHFLPGTKTLSVAAPGCSFVCKNCQNWQLSQGGIDKNFKRDISPQKIVEEAQEKTPSISYTYGEPIIFLEYALETMKLAKEKNLKNIWVSNGYFSDPSLKAVLPYLDAINVDLKSFSDDFYQKICNGKLKPVLKSIKKIAESDTWLEITTLLIPGFNDDDKQLSQIAEFIVDLSPKIPWHVSAFSGNYSWDMKDVPDTPIETLKKAYEIGKNAGLKYVYIGNAMTDKRNTYCPNCERLLIERERFSIERKDEKGVCPDCKEEISLILK